MKIKLNIEQQKLDELLNNYTWDEKNKSISNMILDAQVAMFNSLFKNGSIPERRRKYLFYPEYNVSTRGKKSRWDSIQLKSRLKLRNPHLLKHLQYIIYGPKIESYIIEEINNIIKLKCFHDDQIDALQGYIGRLRRRHKLRKNQLQEFYKYAIELEFSPEQCNRLL